jgi:DNA end-binding protein Ku
MKKQKKKETVKTPLPSHGLWSGTISFSLVAIPVRLVPAVEPGRISFRLLHNKDYSPLERRMFCPQHQTIVPKEEIIRGYETAPGKYVTISDQELESVSPETSRTIEITEFVDKDEIDPLYYNHPFFLLPLKGGEKAYLLLAEALKMTGKAGVAKFVLDDQEYPVIIKYRDGTLEAITLHYRQEIAPQKDFIKKGAKFLARDKAALEKTIKKMTTKFAPQKYANQRREKLLGLLKKKIAKKQEVTAPEIEEAETSEEIVDLMAALEESMRRLKNK